MTSRAARLAAPKLLPGIAAGTWARVVMSAWIVSAVLFVIGFVFEFVGPLKHVLPFPGFVLIVPAVIMSVGLRFGSLVGLPKEKAEVAAGYTTLRRKHANLEQLDPKSGAVVRAAGEPYLRRPALARTADEPGDIGVAKRPGILRRVAPMLLSFVGSAIFILVVYVFVGHVRIGELSALLIIWPAVFLLIAIAIAVGSIGMRRKLLRLRAAAPSEFAFVFRGSKGFGPAIEAVTPGGEIADPGLNRSSQATASTAGITFWLGDPPHPVAKLAWSRVISVQQDQVRFGSRTYPSVVVTFRDEKTDQVLALPLMNAEANYLVLPSVAEARWIASELNERRSSGSTARVL